MITFGETDLFELVLKKNHRQMKTPKRSFNFRDDGSWGAMFYNSRTWRDNSARWKRKNKEAQLKRTIARLKREHAKSEIEYQRKLAHWRGRAFAAEIACESLCTIYDFMNKAYLHDVEGS